MKQLLSSVALSVALSVAVLLGLVHVMPQAQEDLSTIRQATWRVDMRDGWMSGSCSGVFIKENIMLTAAHCDASEMTVAGKQAVKLKKDDRRDLMLLYVPLESKTVDVALREARLDEKVVVVGYPLGVGSMLTEGLSQGLKTIPEAGSPEEFLLASAPIGPGNSGGPLFIKDKDGWKVAGIASRGGSIVYLFISVKDIQHFLANVS